MKIISIQLPSQTGCQHIHFNIQINGVTTMYAYHFNDFKAAKTILNDPIYDLIYSKIQELRIPKRADIKTRLTGLTL